MTGDSQTNLPNISNNSTETDTETETETDTVIVRRDILYHPFSLIFIAAAAGIVTDKFFSFVMVFWLIFAAVAFLLCLIFHYKSYHVSSTIFLLLLCFAFFGFWHHERWNKFADDDLGFYAVKGGYPVGVRAVVSELPRLIPPVPDNFLADEERTIFTIRCYQLRDGSIWKKVSGNVLVTINGNRTDLMPGNEIQIFGELSKPVNAQNPDDNNIADKLRSQRILCVIHCKADDAVSKISDGRISVTKILGIIRSAAKKNLEAATSKETASLASAMLLGVRDGIDDQTRQDLIDTGTMHILAISGLHVAVVAVCFQFLFLLCGFSNRITALLTIFIVVQYLFLTNMAPPAIRAAALITVISIAAFTGRRAYGINSFCATAVLALILNPAELFQFGAQLSYIATAAFFWIPNPKSIWIFFNNIILRNDNSKRVSELTLIEQVNRDNNILYHLSAKFFYGLRELFIVGLVIWSISTPLVLNKIHVFTPIAILVNPLLWLPLYAAMSSGFLTMAGGSIPILGEYLGMTADLSFNVLFGVITFFQKLGGHYWVFSFPLWWNIIFYSVFIFVTIMPFRRPRRLILLTAVVIWFLIGFSSFWVSDIYRYYSDKLTIDVLAVGHGNCVLITTPSKKLIVYDIGCITSSRRAADILSRNVWRKGRMRIDTIIISHADRDHFNGLEKIIERFDVGEILVSPYMFLKPLNKKQEQGYSDMIRVKELLQKQKIKITEISGGDDLSKYGLINSIILHPPKRGLENAEQNATSLTVRFEHRGVSILLPADLNDKKKTDFLNNAPIHCDVMMIPHHGGKSDVTEPLLRWSTPKLLIISDGGFTRRAVSIDDYNRRNFIVHSTHDSGFIRITINKKGWTYERK
jgi:competence protein ComEC